MVHSKLKQQTVFSVLLLACCFLSNDLRAQQSWTQWGGENGRNFSANDLDLAKEVSFNIDWKRDLGSGYSGILAEGDRLFTHFRDDKEEVAICLNATNGETVWQHRYEAILPEEANKDFGEGPNSTPILAGDRVDTVGFLGDMICFDKTSGDVVWKTNLGTDHGATELGFGYSASPLLYDGNIILPIGGEGKSLMAFKVEDGSVAWSSLDYPISYCTPLLISVDGVDQLVMSLTESVISVNPKTGKELWSFPLKNQWDTHAFVPIWNEAEQVLFISSFRQTHALKLTTSDTGEVNYESQWGIENTGIGFTNAVQIGGSVYGITGSSRSPVVTAFNMESGEVTWKERGFATANFVSLNGERLMLLDEKGNLAIADPNAEGLNVASQQKVLDSDKGWTFPTVIGNRVYVRDQKQIAAIDLK